MIPQATVDKILDAAKIEEVVNDFVTLKRRGASLVACCPFHNEKTPSFYVTPSKGIFKCFGCQKAGSAVGFVMEYEHCSYADALKYLARKYHIEVEEKEESPEEIARKQHNESLMLVYDFAQKFYSESLHTAEGKALALAYLRGKRGLEDETIAEFGLGWAPSGRDAFTQAALKAGYKEEYLIEADLCRRYEDGRLVDRFRERVMFPIHSLTGRSIAYSARTLKSDPEISKYVNSSETPVYIKSRSLYGIFLAKAEISRQDRCYLLEGNVDVVTMHQLGIRNVVASCGTALTEEQVRLIHKFTSNITVMYDGDKAGIHAAQRAVSLILKEDMNVSLVLFPDGDDPDDFCRKHTLEEVRGFISENEMDFVSYMALVNPEAQNDPLKRAALISEISDAVSLISDPVKMSVFVDALSVRMNIGRDVIMKRISDTRRRAVDDERKERARVQRRIEAGLAPKPGDDRPSAPQPLSDAARILGPAEKDLLKFVLVYGTSPLEFESDSDFYADDENGAPTVADFIRDSLEADAVEFSDPVLWRTYLSYFERYDSGLGQDEIIRSLINSPDREQASIVVDLTIEKHRLTVRNFEESLTIQSSWLVNYVPKAILVYHDRRLEYEIKSLMKSLACSEDEDESLLERIQELKRMQTVVKIKLGREKKQ